MAELHFGLKTFETLERDIIRERMYYFDGNRTHTAKSLKIGLRTLQRKIKKFELDIPYSATGARGKFGQPKPIPMKDSLPVQQVADFNTEV